MTSTVQRDVRAGQFRLDLQLPTGRPLIPVAGVMVFLDCNEDDVAARIADRLFRYAFDISSKAAQRSEPRVLRESVLEYSSADYRRITANRFPTTRREEQRFETETRRAIESILPHRKQVLRTPEISRLLSCSKQHIHDLLLEGELVATRAATKNTSAEITRASLIDFLIRRRMPVPTKDPS